LLYFFAFWYVVPRKIWQPRSGHKSNNPKESTQFFFSFLFLIRFFLISYPAKTCLPAAPPSLSPLSLEQGKKLCFGLLGLDVDQKKSAAAATAAAVQMPKTSKKAGPKKTFP
jgi:hypothetical protein